MILNKRTNYEMQLRMLCVYVDLTVRILHDTLLTLDQTIALEWLEKQLDKTKAAIENKDHNIVEMLTDGDSLWDVNCPECGGIREVVRPGAIQCSECAGIVRRSPQ